MAKKPIIFSDPMVRAILAGHKTQTRRVIKLPIESDIASINLDGQGNWVMWAPIPVTDEQSIAHYPNGGGYPCPYGKPGDQLWVRESWRELIDVGLGHNFVVYRADGELLPAHAPNLGDAHWRPSIFMPRWASRITLRVTDVRAERLQDISEEDAKAEGATAWHDTIDGTVYRPDFHIRWDDINAKRGYPWASNCWVWAITFEVPA